MDDVLSGFVSLLRLHEGIALPARNVLYEFTRRWLIVATPQNPLAVRGCIPPRDTKFVNLPGGPCLVVVLSYGAPSWRKAPALPARRDAAGGQFATGLVLHANGPHAEH